MRPHEIELPEELEERLKEWARYFKDRHRFTRCGSIEGRFTRFHPDFKNDDGWDDPGPPGAISPPVVMPRVLKTHACVMGLSSKAQRWAITFRYCYPAMARHQVLKAMRKYADRKFNWKEQENELEMGRIRVWACLSR